MNLGDVGFGALMAQAVEYPAIAAHGFLRKDTSGVGVINVPLPSGAVEGRKMLYVQMRQGTTLPDAYGGGETSLVEALPDHDDGPYEIATRVAWIEVTSGMESDGYIALHVGSYGSGLTMIFDRDDVVFRAVNGTPGNAANWEDGPNAIGGGHATMNTTAGLAGDLAINLVITKAYGAQSVGSSWANYLAGAIPSSIGATVNGNPAVFTQEIETDGQATGATAYTTDGPDNSYTNIPIFVRVA
ncbi:MAG TPA: hypothetical protein PKA33_01770 [Amaricoccus sp.]|uniref:hypothetical protein n=1 Tax=Amaricoccus sp. TaxID=1872485 RepID=UPI002B68FC54|nr:hypothetical protein [Amaricoccus sp.]HMR51177.1 hypothetical protein [Amaricoccus sp.]HMT98075.1 hypothetical protein [Amaricoccus sp.]